MNERHVITVGISLLTNFERAKNVERSRAIRQSKALDAFLAADPRAASAEINALIGRLGGLTKVGKGLCASLVYTQTAEGKAAVGALKRFLKKRGVAVSEIKLQSIELPAASKAEPGTVIRMAEDGLRQLREKVGIHVEKMRANDPNTKFFFNVTGGYKAEIAVLYALGRSMEIPVYYLHESYKSVIELP